jgi:hypothetical protein
MSEIAEDNELAVHQPGLEWQDEYLLEDYDALESFGLLDAQDMRRVANLLNEAADKIESQ